MGRLVVLFALHLLAGGLHAQEEPFWGDGGPRYVSVIGGEHFAGLEIGLFLADNQTLGAAGVSVRHDHAHDHAYALVHVMGGESLALNMPDTAYSYAFFLLGPELGVLPTGIGGGGVRLDLGVGSAPFIFGVAGEKLWDSDTSYEQWAFYIHYKF